MKQKNDTTAYPGLGAYLRNYFRQSFAVLKNPKQLLPTIALGVIWLVLGIVGSNFWELPLPLWILSFLTYAQGGLYGGLLAAAGGIVGKVVIAAFLNAMIVPLFQGKKPFSGVAGGITGLFRGAAAQGIKEASPLTGGAGAALLLYGFMNSRQDMQEAMVGIVAIIMLLKNIGTKGGFMTGLLFSAAQTFSRGRTPSRITVDRILSGLTIGFTLAVALTLLPFRPCVWVGLVLFVVSIILSFFGKGGKEPVNRKASMAKPKKGQKALKLNLLAILFVSGILAAVIFTGSAVTAFAGSQWVDPYTQFGVESAEGFFEYLQTNPVEKLRVMPSAWEGDDRSKEISLEGGSSAVIDLAKGAESRIELGFRIYGTDRTTRYGLTYSFTGDPSAPYLFKANLELTVYDADGETVLSQEGFDNIAIGFSDSDVPELARGFLVDTNTDCTLMLSIVGAYAEGFTRKGSGPIDFGAYMDQDRYKIEISPLYIEKMRPDEYESNSQLANSLGISMSSNLFGTLRYSVHDKQNKYREIVHQDCYYYRYSPEIMKTALPAGAAYPQWYYKETWAGNSNYGFNPNGRVAVVTDDHTPMVSDMPGMATSKMFAEQVQLRYSKDTGKPVGTVYLDTEANWGVEYRNYSNLSHYGVSHFDADKGETWEQQKARRNKENAEYLLKQTYITSKIKNGGDQSIEEYDMGDGAHIYKVSIYMANSAESGQSDGYKTYKYLSKSEDWYYDYLITLEYPELPLCTWNDYLFVDGGYHWKKPVDDAVTVNVPNVESYVGAARGYLDSLPDQLLQAIVNEPLNVVWFDPEWAPGYDPDTGKLSESGSTGSNGSTDNSGSSGNSGSIGGSMFGSLYDDEADYDSGSDAGAGDAWTEAYSGGDSSPYVFNDPGYYDLNNGNHAGYYDEYLWDHHVGGMDSALRTLISWVFSLLFAGGIGGTLGGGIGGAIGGSVGGAPGGFPGGPGGEGDWSGEGLPYDGEGGIPDGQVPGDTAQKDPYHWDNPVPKGWKVNSEGDISYKDPATGERMTYYLTGYDPDTGEPQYLSEKSGFTFGESTLRENYDDRGRNAGTLRQDYETGQQWQQEQHAQNQARWDQERATGKTEMSEAWKRDREQMSKEQYLEKLAEKYGKSVDDLKGIKKEIIKERVAAETEQQEQMAKDAWLEFGEKTASQLESVADTSINVLGEVTGPAGKTIKNIYTFAKPGLTKLAEAGAQGKDVYEAMTMIAQGTAEGAIGVLQNEIDGFGMAIGGDLVKTGLDGVVKGKSMDEITADLTQTAYQSSLNYGIGQLISSAGKKASDKLTAGKSMELGKNIDAYGDYGVSWKNMSVDMANQNMAKMRISNYKKMTAEITKTENWTSAATNLFSDVFKKNVTGQATELIGETAKAEMQGFLNDSGEVIRRYKRGQDF